MRYEVLPSDRLAEYALWMHQFRRLDVWQESVELAVDIYRITTEFPSDERFGLISQMRRAAVSVSSNIAEGAGRGSGRDMARFLKVAVGSLCELESQIEVATRLGFIDDADQFLSTTGLLKIRIRALENRVLIPDT